MTSGSLQHVSNSKGALDMPICFYQNVVVSLVHVKAKINRKL